MTVLNILQCTNLGGMERVAFRVMSQLAEDGFRFRMATPRPFGPGAEDARHFDADMRDFPYRGRFGWRDFPAFRRHVHRLAAECERIWLTGTAAAALASVIGIRRPKVLSHHYHHFENGLSWARWRSFYEIFGRQLDAVTYPTAFTRDEAVRIAPWLAKKAVVVPNGVFVAYKDEETRLRERRAARVALGIPENAFVVGNAGWLIRRKRFDVFIRVAAQVAKSLPESRFVICGDGPEGAALRGLASELGLGERVTFAGWVKDLEKHYRAWDLSLFNSDYDALGMTPLEAAAQGCVVVASVAYGGLSEFIESGASGVLYDRHDIEALARTILALAADPAEILRLRKGAVAMLREKCGREISTGFYRDFFGQGAQS